MPDSLPDYPSHISSLERKLRGLKRKIIGTAAVGASAVSSPDDDISFEARFEEAMTDWACFQQLWSELDDVHAIAGSTFPSQLWLDIYDTVWQEILTSKTHMIRIQRRSQASQANPAQDVRQSINNASFLSCTKPHLPPIPLPQFSGNLLHWRQFKDTFLSMVHDEPSLTNVERFHFLVGALKGEAASLISAIPIGDQTYAQAWTKITDTYDNSRVLASFLIQNILEYDPKDAKGELQRYDNFLTGVADSIQAFKSLKMDNSTEFLLASLALRALDAQTRRQFELTQSSSSTFPSSDDVIKFVRQRKMAVTLSKDINPTTSNSSKESSTTHSNSRFPSRKSTRYNFQQNPVALHGYIDPSSQVDYIDHSSSLTRPSPRDQWPNRQVPCPFCQGSHILPMCFKFSNSPPHERSSFATSLKCCRNCLRLGHAASDCKAKWRCRFCKKNHHSLLHLDNERHADNPSRNVSLLNHNQAPSTSENNFVGFGSVPTFNSNVGTALLGTAQIYIQGQDRCLIPARAVFDSGSHHTFITLALAMKVGATLNDFNGHITGIGGSAVSKPAGVINCSIQSPYSNEHFNSCAVVVENISAPLPNVQIGQSILHKLLNYRLADENFHTPGTVDVLIGMDLYPVLITGAPYFSGLDQLYLLPTKFGLLVIGSVNHQSLSQSVTLLAESTSCIETQLKAFWESEEPKPADREDPLDKICEDHFCQTYSRAEDGRYILRLPFHPDTPPLGENRGVVTKRFLNLERRFNTDQQLAESYKSFMQEYSSLGHMSPATSKSPYLIPHHGVWQGHSSTRKLRVVFDASCSSNTSCSLNSKLLSGPKLQNDIGEILTQFRLFRIPLCCDIVKMYRQILIHPDDRHYQHVLWRDHPSHELTEQELNTVTYGTRSSAYQAMRVVQQLLIDEGHQYPLAASIIPKSIYVDDVVCGANTITEALELKAQLISLFSKGQFPLSKWASNHSQLIPTGDKIEPVQIQQPDDHSLKILGMVWNPTNDIFSYSVIQPPQTGVTKRIILSSIMRIFDPLGLISPVTLLVKILLQDIWVHKLEWDQKVPQDINDKWCSITQEWHILSLISISRYISYQHPSFTLIGFCDASTKGYSASVYLRADDNNENVQVSLIKAKTKVAPLQYTSIARLELCGALLLARVLASINLPQLRANKPICFTDSNVVLSWLRIPVHQLKVYEANRVSEILSKTQLDSWCHVKSEDNPSDISSRGCLPHQLKGNILWWHGPQWLSQPKSEWYQAPIIESSSLIVSPVVKKKNFSDAFMERCSNPRTLFRVVARILRWVSIAHSPRISLAGPVSATEFQSAKLRCVHIVQGQHQSTLLALKQLSPFVDQLGTIRVGGRLHHSPLKISSRHPILLPQKCHLSHIIIRDLHEQHFHSGPNLTLSLLRNEFWIPNSLKIIRSIIHRCSRCRILHAEPIPPIMASLPKERFSQVRPFLQTGMDFAGPFLVKDSIRRKASTSKAYLCLFVCLSTKALHIETVSALTTVAFIAALERFISRRGIPQCLWSDHGTNFVGASSYLQDIYKFIIKNEEELSHWLAPRKILWKFIPPRAPHFGGIWEAGVKSIKKLLQSEMGSNSFTFEELATALIKIEAILNSRPLCALNEDPENCDYLTPSHFIIGSPISALPEPCEDPLPKTPLNRWEAVQHRVSSIWNRWRQEYLHTLQQKGKWRKDCPNLKVGDLVIMVERRTLIGQWPVARIAEIHPGKDGTVRTVTIKVPNGKTFMRPVVSLVPLLTESNN